MDLKEYFEKTPGKGIFSSAAANGQVTSAIYSRPKIIDDQIVAFIMREHLTYANMQENPFATFLYMEEGLGSTGIRLYLEKISEDNDPELIAAMTRRHLTPEEDKAKGPKHIVYFKITKILKLVGDESPDIDFG